MRSRTMTTVTRSKRRTGMALNNNWRIRRIQVGIMPPKAPNKRQAMAPAEPRAMARRWAGRRGLEGPRMNPLEECTHRGQSMMCLTLDPTDMDVSNQQPT